MKILHLLSISNAISLVLGVTVAFVAGGSWIVITIGLIAAVACVAGLSVLLARQFTLGLRLIEQSVATAHQEGRTSRIQEFDETRNNLGRYVQRWSVAANRSREQNKTVGWIVDTLERRATERDGTSTSDTGNKLRGILTGITRQADSYLRQIVESIDQIQTAVKQMSDITVSHGADVAKSTSYVEQLSESIACMSNAAKNARANGDKMLACIENSRQVLGEQLLSLRRIQTGVESGENRLRGLLGQAREIGAIANSIADISARTDLLALNLSIESARQSGSRGSSNVAEEVRRLAEQAAHAAQEVTGLVESVQLETQESIATIAQQNKDLTAELSKVEVVVAETQEIVQTCQEISRDLDTIRGTSSGQVRQATELIAFVEDMVRVAGSCREQSEAVVWNAGSLASASAQFDELLEPLRAICFPSTASNDGTSKQSNVAPESSHRSDSATTSSHPVAATS